MSSDETMFHGLRLASLSTCSQVERYDPLSNKWTMMAPLRDGVSNAAVVSAKLKLFVFGGSTIHRDKVSKVSGFVFSSFLTIPSQLPFPKSVSNLTTLTELRVAPITQLDFLCLVCLGPVLRPRG